MKKVAVIEDNPDNMLLVQAILEDIYEVIEFYDGKSALKSFETDIPDIILMDISLPDMDGTEILRLLKEDLATEKKFLNQKIDLKKYFGYFRKKFVFC